MQPQPTPSGTPPLEQLRQDIAQLQQACNTFTQQAQAAATRRQQQQNLQARVQACREALRPRQHLLHQIETALEACRNFLAEPTGRHQHAVARAYQQLLCRGRHPICGVYLPPVQALPRNTGCRRCGAKLARQLQTALTQPRQPIARGASLPGKPQPAAPEQPAQ